MIKYFLNEYFFEEIDTEEKAYWLGFLYADGNVYYKQTKYGNVRLKLSSKDRAHLELFLKSLNSNSIIKDGTSNVKYKNIISNSDFSYISLWNTKLSNDLVNKGCVPNKTFKLVYPKFLTDNLINHFIRGYFDGDGTISITNNKKRIGKQKVACKFIGTYNFLSGVQSILENKGIKSVLFKYNSIFILNISLRDNNLIKFRDFLYKNCSIFLERKKVKFDTIKVYDAIKSYRERVRKRAKYKIIQLDKNMNFINEWNCISDILDKNYFSRSNISKCCNGKLKTANGYIWKYQKINL